MELLEHPYGKQWQMNNGSLTLTSGSSSLVTTPYTFNMGQGYSIGAQNTGGLQIISADTISYPTKVVVEEPPESPLDWLDRRVREITDLVAA